MSNPDYVGIEGETFTDDELEDNFQDYLDNEMPEFTFGNLSYGAGRVLREIDYTAFREEFNNWIDSEDHIDEWREDHPWLDDDEDEDEDGPVCEDCGEDMDQDEVAVALADHGPCSASPARRTTRSSDIPRIGNARIETNRV